MREEHRDSEERIDELKVLCFKRERRYTAVASLQPFLPSFAPRPISPRLDKVFLPFASGTGVNVIIKLADIVRGSHEMRSLENIRHLIEVVDPRILQVRGRGYTSNST